MGLLDSGLVSFTMVSFNKEFSNYKKLMDILGAQLLNNEADHGGPGLLPR